LNKKGGEKVIECEHEGEHERLVERAKAEMPKEEHIALMCDMLKILGEPSRMRIVLTLLQGEMCVLHIVEAVGGNQSAVSQQLRILKHGRLIKSRREGKNVLYSIADEHVVEIVKMGLEHARELE
jgi:ArsR family transcriptional regulator